MELELITGKVNFDFDGDVDGIDFLALQQAISAGSVLSVVAVTVPEPPALLLVVSIGTACVSVTCQKQEVVRA